MIGKEYVLFPDVLILIMSRKRQNIDFEPYLEILLSMSWSSKEFPKWSARQVYRPKTDRNTYSIYGHKCGKKSDFFYYYQRTGIAKPAKVVYFQIPVQLFIIFV